APEGDAVVLPLSALADRAAAARARLAAAVIDGARPRLEAVVRRLGHALAREGDERKRLFVAHLAGRPPRIHAGREAALGLPQVADPGHRALIEQGIADRAAWIVGTEIAQEQLAVEMLSEDVGPETREARIRARTRVAHQLEHRAVELDDLETVGADHQPRPSPRAPP